MINCFVLTTIEMYKREVLSVMYKQCKEIMTDFLLVLYGKLYSIRFE